MIEWKSKTPEEKINFILAHGHHLLWASREGIKYRSQRDTYDKAKFQSAMTEILASIDDLVAANMIVFPIYTRPDEINFQHEIRNPVKQEELPDFFRECFVGNGTEGKWTFVVDYRVMVFKFESAKDAVYFTMIQ